MNTEWFSQALDLLSKKIPEIIQEHWLKIVGTIIGSVALWIFYRLVAYYKFQRRRTDNTITISVNKIEPATDKTSKQYSLCFFTLADGPLSQFISLSIAAQDLFCRATKKTTVANPLIDMSKLDSVAKDVMNSISSIFAEGIIARDRGLPVHEFEYVVVFTCERFPLTDPHWNQMWEKPRILLIEKNALRDTNFTDENNFLLETEHHIWRVRTLRQAQQDFNSNKPKSCITIKIFLRK